MERRITSSAPVAVAFDLAHPILGEDPGGVVGPFGASYELHVGDVVREPDALVVPVLVRHRAGPLHHLAAELRLRAHLDGSELALGGRYRWEPRHRRYGSGVVAHRAVQLLVDDLVTGTARALELRAGA